MGRRFRFPLETLLRVRELREREAQRRVAVQLGAIGAVDRENDSIRSAIDACWAERRIVGDDQRLDTIEAGRSRAFVASMQRRMAQNQQARDQLEHELREHQHALALASQRKLTIEKLRQRRQSDHRTRQRRREQTESDEMARIMLIRNTNNDARTEEPQC